MPFTQPIEIKKSSGLGNLVKIGTGVATGGLAGGLGAAAGFDPNLITRAREFLSKPSTFVDENFKKPDFGSSLAAPESPSYGLGVSGVSSDPLRRRYSLLQGGIR